MALETESPWQTVVAIALVGTDRQPLKPLNIAGKLGVLLRPLQDKSPEAAILTTAAVLALHQQAGQLPEKRAIAGSLPCCREDLPRCSPRATHFLQRMLQGEYAEVLPEWLAAAAQAGQRVPEKHLPELLDLGQRQQALRQAILPVLGQRGQWLAAQNSNWSYGTGYGTELDWDTSSVAARFLWLQQKRVEDADAARERLATTWQQESASDRAKFLATLETNLSLADEPFLEIALGDRSKEVRRVAVDLLASLTNSRFCRQMLEQSRLYVTLTPGKSASLAVQLPTALDAALIQSGLEPKCPDRLVSTLGEKAWWLSQMIAATPLSFWSETWEMTPQQIVQCTKNHEWEGVLLDSWALAAKRQKQPDWIAALLTAWLGKKASQRSVVLVDLSVEDLVTSLSPDQQHAFMANFLQADLRAIDDPMAIWLLRRSSSLWSTDLAQTVLMCLEERLTQSTTPTNFDWELRSALKEFGRFIPISLTAEAGNLLTILPPESPWLNAIEALLSLLQFRQEMVQVFEIGDSR